MQLVSRTTLGEALHQSGRDEAARDRYVEAETMQAEHQPEYPRLYSLRGFRYCDLLLSKAERQAWRHCMALRVQEKAEGLWPTEGSVEKEHRQACEEVAERATQTLDWVVRAKQDLLSIGLDHLTLARTALYRWLIEAGEEKAEEATNLGPMPTALTEHMSAAVNGLRESGDMDELPQALLTQAWSHWVTDPTAAVANLDEAWEIAERGPMPLFQVDILLTRARLFFREDITTAKDNLAEARRLIEKHGYHRRDQELEDAEIALGAAKQTHRHPPIVPGPERSAAVVETSPVAVAVDAPISAKDLLAQLNGLPPPWFEQLVFEFDANNAVSTASAPLSLRAMDLIKVLRVTDPDFSKVRAKIDELKQSSS